VTFVLVIPPSIVTVLASEISDARVIVCPSSALANAITRPLGALFNTDRSEPTPVSFAFVTDNGQTHPLCSTHDCVSLAATFVIAVPVASLIVAVARTLRVSTPLPATVTRTVYVSPLPVTLLTVPVADPVPMAIKSAASTLVTFSLNKAVKSIVVALMTVPRTLSIVGAPTCAVNMPRPWVAAISLFPIHCKS
jgi:hypothetical protein